MKEEFDMEDNEWTWNVNIIHKSIQNKTPVSYQESIRATSEKDAMDTMTEILFDEGVEGQLTIIGAVRCVLWN